MALNTPKRIRTLASLASSPPNSEYGSPPWHTTNNSPSSTCGSPEFVVNQQVSEKNENRRGKNKTNFRWLTFRMNAAFKGMTLNDRLFKNEIVLCVCYTQKCQIACWQFKVSL